MVFIYVSLGVYDEEDMAIRLFHQHIQIYGYDFQST